MREGIRKEGGRNGGKGEEEVRKVCGGGRKRETQKGLSIKGGKEGEGMVEGGSNEGSKGGMEGRKELREGGWKEWRERGRKG